MDAGQLWAVYTQARRNRSGQSGHDPTKILADQDFGRGQKRALATLAVSDSYERILAPPVLRVGSLNLHDDDHESHARYAAESPPVRNEESRVYLMAAGLRHMNSGTSIFKASFQSLPGRPHHLNGFAFHKQTF